MLCAALASCLDATIRTVADRLAVRIEELEVEVNAEADVRGALSWIPTCRWASSACAAACGCGLPKTRTRQGYGALAAAEYGCVVLQTLRKGVAVEMMSSDQFVKLPSSWGRT